MRRSLSTSPANLSLDDSRPEEIHEAGTLSRAPETMPFFGAVLLELEANRRGHQFSTSEAEDDETGDIGPRREASAT